MHRDRLDDRGVHGAERSELFRRVLNESCNKTRDYPLLNAKNVLLYDWTSLLAECRASVEKRGRFEPARVLDERELRDRLEDESLVREVLYHASFDEAVLRQVVSDLGARGVLGRVKSMNLPQFSSQLQRALDDAQ